MSFVIRDKTALSGTAYVELQPGPFDDEFWGDESIYFEEHHWNLLERMLQRHFPDYDHYGFQTIGKASWVPILSDFMRLAKKIESGVTVSDIRSEILFGSDHAEQEFPSEESKNLNELMNTLKETSQWVTSVLDSGSPVSVLGL
nr:putative integron gene cassette protein [uncultured bacterium]